MQVVSKLRPQSDGTWEGGGGLTNKDAISCCPTNKVAYYGEHQEIISNTIKI